MSTRAMIIVKNLEYYARLYKNSDSAPLNILPILASALKEWATIETTINSIIHTSKGSIFADSLYQHMEHCLDEEEKYYPSIHISGMELSDELLSVDFGTDTPQNDLQHIYVIDTIKKSLVYYKGSGDATEMVLNGFSNFFQPTCLDITDAKEALEMDKSCSVVNRCLAEIKEKGYRIGEFK